MKYIGLQSQIWRNNTRSLLLLIGFPVLLLSLTWIFFYLIGGENEGVDKLRSTTSQFLSTLPLVLIVVGIWFLIAYFSHSTMIRMATAAHSLERRDNKRVYNLVENICISVGMPMPKLNVIEDDSLNAFASGINKKTYTVTLSRGIIDKLDDQELEGVIAHELTHIRNKDVRLLIVSIIFVGIFAYISEMAFRVLLYGGGSRSRKDGKGGGAAILVIMVLAIVGLIISTIFRFALSRKREYLADAGAAELTKNPGALASALRKVSQDPRIEAVKRRDVAQLFIEHPQEKKKNNRTSLFSSLFATHPPIKKRIEILEQF